jgi:hypothetical protein
VSARGYDATVAEEVFARNGFHNASLRFRAAELAAAPTGYLRLGDLLEVTEEVFAAP